MPGRASSPPATRPSSASHQRRPGRTRRRVHEQPGRLVDDHQVLVLVDHVGTSIGRRLEVELGAARAPGSSTTAPAASRYDFGRADAVDQHATGLDQPLGAGPASRRPRGRPGTGRAARRPARRRPSCSGITARSSSTAGSGCPDGSIDGGSTPISQQHDADHDEAVGQVERRPVAEVDEVGHVALADAVDQVRDAAADEQPQRDREQHVPRAGAGEVHAASRPRRSPSAPRRSPAGRGRSPNAIPVLRTWRIVEERQHLVDLLQRQPLLDRAAW